MNANYEMRIGMKWEWSKGMEQRVRGERTEECLMGLMPFGFCLTFLLFVSIYILLGRNGHNKLDNK